MYLLNDHIEYLTPTIATQPSFSAINILILNESPVNCLFVCVVG